MRQLVTAFSLLAIVCVATPAAAQNITYTLTGNSSSGEIFSITGLADTSAVYGYDGNSAIPAVLLTSNTISVGSNTGSITESVYFFNNQVNAILGFSFANNGGDFLDFQNALLGPYDLTSAFGPVSANLWYTRAFDTTFGLVNLAESTNLSFQAITVSQAVPEPGTWAMMLIGFSATGFVIRRRRRSGNSLPQTA